MKNFQKNSLIILQIFIFLIVSPLRAKSSNRNGVFRLVILPTNHRLDWSSPRANMKSTLYNTISAKLIPSDDPRKAATVGHMIVNIDCTDSQGQEHNIWSGVSSKNSFDEQMNDIKRKKLGMSLLWKRYKGELQYEDNISLDRVVNYYPRKEKNALGKKVELEPKYISIGMDKFQCDQVVKFHQVFEKTAWIKNDDPNGESFEARPPNQKFYYGGEFVDVYQSYLDWKNSGGQKALGAGCTTFGVGFLSLLNFFDDSFGHFNSGEGFWGRYVHVPFELLGSETQPVSLLNLFFSKKAKSWHSESNQYKVAFIYDPDKIWDFIDGVQECFAFKINSHDSKEYQEKNCTPELYNWVKRNQSRIHPHREHEISGTSFSVKYQFRNQHHPIPRYENKQKIEKKVKLSGIEFIAPTL